jgi:ABC-type multidrug transport system ATPase subunit
LDVLAGRKSGGTIEGSLLFNGKPRDQYFHRFAGYVEQFDSHLPTSTVREAIRFSADTRLPEETTEQDKNNRVESAIQTLGLSAVADSQIGDPLMGGLTNELRKKITIAVELVMQPGLLFLDEPTTGLDASAALAVMTKVKELSASISVICTIHQPSSTVLALFDDLLMLEPGGRVAYQGPMDQLHQYLESNQLGVCPPDQNVSNFALKLLASKKSAFDLDNKQERASDVFLRSQQFQVVANDIKAASQPHDVNKLKFDSIMANTVGSQFGLLLRRSAQSLYRDGQFLRARLFGALTFALMLGSLNYRMGFDVRDAASRVSILFFSCTTPVYSSGAAIPVVQSKRVLLERERVSQMYHRSIFYLTEFLADLPLTLIQSFVYVIPIYFLGGFRTDDASSHFWIYYACVVCLYLAGLSLANFTGNLMESAPSANLLSTSILTFMLLFVGFIIPYAQIPSGWIWYANIFLPS